MGVNEEVIEVTLGVLQLTSVKLCVSVIKKDRSEGFTTETQRTQSFTENL